MALEVGRHERALRHNFKLLVARGLHDKLRQRRADALPAQFGRDDDVSDRQGVAVQLILSDRQMAVLRRLKTARGLISRDVHCAQFNFPMMTAAILAAGSSSRLGQAKQLLKIGDQTLIARTARAVLDAQPARVLVIVGHQNQAIAEALHRLPVEICFNENWREGMASSVRMAVERAAESEALLLLPCDLPLLSSAHLRALMDAWKNGDAEIVASRYAETVGAPLVIGRALWPELLALRGDAGARRIVARHGAREIEWPDGVLDVDTPGDWEKIRDEL